MPTVPRFNQGLTPIQNLPQVRVSPDAPQEAFGGGQSAQQAFGAAQGVGKAISEIAIQEKQRADDTATQDYYAKLATKRNDLIYGSKDPQTGQMVPGAMSKRGRDAFGVSETYGGEFDKYADELEKNLSSDAQRFMAKRIRDRERLELTSALDKHTFQESRNFEDATNEAAILTAREDAAKNWSNPDKVKQALETQRTLIASDPKGLGGVYVGMKIKEAESKTHHSVINSMLDSRLDQEAQKYFEANKDQLTAEDKDSAFRLLRTGYIQGESQRGADEAMKAHGNDLDAALSAARKKYEKDPEVRKDVVSEIKMRFEENEKTKRLQLENQSGYTMAHITSTLTLPPAKVWNTLTDDNKKAATEYLRKLRAGEPIKTDPATYYDLQRLATTKEDEFLKTDLNQYVDRVSKKDLEGIMSVQRSIREGRSEVDRKTLEGVQTKQQIVDGRLKSMGIDPTPKQGTKAADLGAQFRKSVDDEVIRLQIEKKRPLHTQELQDVVDTMALKAKVESAGIFSAGEKPIYQLKFEDIPKEELSRIETVLKAKGIKASKEQKLRYYMQKVKNSKNGQ